VQAAVDAASDGDVIKVATGTYIDLHTAVVDWKTITQVVTIRKGITIQGGYTTANWDVPDPVANPTVLDARGQGRVFYVSGAVSPTIAGLCIAGGDAAGLGGGPLGEDAGGGMYVTANAVVLSDNRVFSNTATYGGGLYLDYSAATLSGNTVISNTAHQGGGLFLFGGVVTLSGGAVVSNSATYGGGLFLSSSAATLSDNTIASNAANFFGGGLLLWRSDDAVLDRNIVAYNGAGYGGGLYLHESGATLANNVVAGNRADTAGSGLYVLASSPRLLHATIVGNGSAELTAGGWGSVRDLCPTAGVHVTNYGSDYSSIVLTNTILVGHTVGVTVTAGNTAALEATLWGADVWANDTDSGGAGMVHVGTRNYWGDPDFVASSAGDYHIGLASAALDKGVNAGVTDDMDGDSRPQSGSYDLGADETGLLVTKQAASNLVEPGAQLNYAIRVTNTSAVTLTAAITDILPNDVAPTGFLTWMPVTIPSGDVWIQTVVVTVEMDRTGPLTNAVQVTTDEGPGGFTVETSMVGYGVYLPVVLRSH